MKRMMTTAAVLLVLSAAATQGQSIAVGGRAGTLGLGAEAAVGIGQRLGVRAGFGVIPMKPTGTFSDVKYEVEPPSPLMTLGLDFYLTKGLRLFGGVLMGADTTTIIGEYTGTVQIGDQTYTGSQVGTLTGGVEANSLAPYAGIGFGHYFGSGLGLTLDLGAAKLDPQLTLVAGGPIKNDATFQANLEKERQSTQDDLDKYAKWYPVINLGLHISLGR